MPKVEIPAEVARAVYEALLKPVKDIHGHPGYWLNANDARVIRIAIGDALEGKQDG